MPTAPACVLSKIRRPGASALMARPALHRQLDRLRRSVGNVWISAPAGSGKTALLASYLDGAGGQQAWYQLDEHDADPARLFRYLALAFGCGADAAPPPVWRQEHPADLACYAQRYFARLFSMDAPGVLVLDHCDAVRDPGFGALLRMVLDAVPVQVSVIMLSRQEPPAALGALVGARRLALFEGRQLRLSEAETHALVTRHLALAGREAKPADTLAPMLHARTRGWAAGLAVLLEQDSGPMARAVGLHDYFAEEVFAACAVPVRKFLLHTAVLASFNAEMAQSLGGSAALSCLAAARRQQYFIEGCELAGELGDVGDLSTFRYQPLFREFLLAQLQIAFTVQECLALRRRALALAPAAGDLANCAELQAQLGPVDCASPLAEPAWPLRVRTLGAFEVALAGRALEQGVKGKRRTLDLLKVLAAFGGRRVAIERITAALWPDAEGDSAKGAFDVAMHRLRKLAGGAHFFQVSGGSVSLNEDACWLDVWEFEALAQTAIDGAAAAQVDADALASAAGAVLACYRGPFLQNESEQPWQLHARARHAQMYACAVGDCVRRLLADGHAQLGQSLAQRAALRLPHCS